MMRKLPSSATACLRGHTSNRASACALRPHAQLQHLQQRAALTSTPTPSPFSYPTPSPTRTPTPHTLTRLSMYRLPLPLHDGASYKWSNSKSVTVFDATLVRLETSGGLVGWGEVTKPLTPTVTLNDG